jgi:hypothetical protein
VAYGNGLFVTVSGKGEVFTSPDAITWTARNSGFANFLASVVFAQGRFVASGWAGTVITSTDGITWTTPTPATTQCLNSVIYNATNSHFIACGAAAGFVSSTDGLTWTQTSFYGGPALALIAEPTGQTVKTRANGFTINTGATLTGETAAVVAFTGLNLHAVGFGNSQFVAVGDNGAIFTSADGLSWSNEALVTTYSGSPPSLAGVIFAGGQWVAVGGVSADTILTSADGLTWVDHSKRTSNTLLSVSYGGGKYVAVGNSGKILYSTDGKTWTAATSGVSDNLLAVAYGNGVFVAVGGTSSIITSSDGITWQAKSFFAGQNVRFDNGLFVAINGTGITTSPDGVTWTARARPSNFVNATSFGNGIYLTVAATGDGVLTFVSRDTSTWYSVTSPCPMSVSGLRSIAFDGMQFVAVGDNGAILRATPSWPSLTQWRTVFYDTSANQGNAADTAAPINDHVPNLLKYAIGIDPRQNGAASLPTGQVLFDASTGANYLTMTINREGIAPGITYIVEVSADLTTWKSVPGTDVVYLSNTALLLEVRDNVPIPSSGSLSRFIRLRITDP